MLRYFASAMALKAFSVNHLTKRLYRTIGNSLGERRRKRGTHVDAYIERGNLFRELSAKYQITNTGDRMLEIGTGWVHWHSIYHRLFHDVEITMLDVWDCRQFGAIRTVFGTVKNEIDAILRENPTASRNLSTTLAAESFADLYRDLGLNYRVEETGSLDFCENESLDCVFSFHVLEHVPKENVENLVASIHRVLRPGGFSVHQIGIDDHLQHYDPKMSTKNYIRYSDRTWKLLFENGVQYFNRLQKSEWLTIFNREDLVQLESIGYYTKIDELPVDSRFEGYSQDDLTCTTLTIVHQKPPSAGSSLDAANTKTA